MINFKKMMLVPYNEKQIDCIQKQNEEENKAKTILLDKSLNHAEKIQRYRSALSKLKNAPKMQNIEVQTDQNSTINALDNNTDDTINDLIKQTQNKEDTINSLNRIIIQERARSKSIRKGSNKKVSKSNASSQTQSESNQNKKRKIQEVEPDAEPDKATKLNQMLESYRKDPKSTRSLQLEVLPGQTESEPKYSGKAPSINSNQRQLSRNRDIVWSSFP